MSSNQSTAIISKKREDYRAPSHLITHVDLHFHLNPEKTTVVNKMKVSRQDKAANSIELDGEDLTFISLRIDGKLARAEQDYVLKDDFLTVLTSLDDFTLEVTNSISPIKNTSLEGLYFSKNAYCTQCEAEGFRKITYFLDRPDVLSIYRVSISTDNPDLSYLLSNGNLISDSMEEGTRTCVWQDPHPKPCYLFALVAGHFDLLEDSYTTGSGRKVSLQLFVDEGRLNRGQHALDSLKKAMQWDEDTYGLEYDLDIYMVVAVDFFNMGAMENKGLNVFNSKFVLANPNTATDQDYFNIESIIAHEYFHNWTGNRVTCRDWFQLSLKEGLTVFRDQQFSADMFSHLITRISQVDVMRQHQFAEDASSMSHPIRPDEVMEMNNFYTVTVYDKGAEVIRMMHTLLGKEGFRKGMDLYFERHDGQAVTCDDFVNAMQDANDHDLTHFKRWYSQSGTPIIKVSVKTERTESDGNVATMRFRQINRPSAAQCEKHDLFIPIKMECFDSEGRKIDTKLANDTFVLSEAEAELRLPLTSDSLTPSLLQEFSAPVIVEYDYSFEQLLTIIQHASSDYAKWEASQRYFTKLIALVYEAREQTQQSETDEGYVSKYIQMLGEAFAHLDVRHEVRAQLLTVPSVESIMAEIASVKPIYLATAHTQVVSEFARNMRAHLHQLYSDCSSDVAYAYEKSQVHARRLKNSCLLLLAHVAENADKTDALIRAQYETSDNMTDKLGALKAAQINPKRALFNDLMITFESEYGDDAVVMDKWFVLHATTMREDILSQLDLLQSHPQFSEKNPNKVRSLIGSFAFYNIVGFHQAHAKGYQYVADYLIKLDKINPQVAARIITPLIQFSGLSDDHQSAIKRELNRIFGTKGLSKDLFEKISKSLLSDKLDENQG